MYSQVTVVLLSLGKQGKTKQNKDNPGKEEDMKGTRTIIS